MESKCAATLESVAGIPTSPGKLFVLCQGAQLLCAIVFLLLILDSNGCI